MAALIAVWASGQGRVGRASDYIAAAVHVLVQLYNPSIPSRRAYVQWATGSIGLEELNTPWLVGSKENCMESKHELKLPRRHFWWHRGMFAMLQASTLVT